MVRHSWKILSIDWMLLAFTFLTGDPVYAQQAMISGCVTDDEEGARLAPGTGY